MDNDELKYKKIADYFSGHLDEKEKEELLREISGSEELQRAFRTMSLLSEQMKKSVASEKEGEVDYVLLAQYYINKNSLDEKTVKEIENKIAADKDWAYDYEFLREMEQELEHSVSRELAQPTFWEKTFSTTRAIVLKPAVAYFLLALTLYPAISWLYQQTAPEPEGEIDVWSGTSYLLSGSVRSGGGIPVVIRSVTDSLVYLSLPYYHLTDDYSYDIYLTDEERDTVFSVEEITNFKEPKIIRLIMNTSGLPDRDYLLVLDEISKSDTTETSQSSYLFRLTTK